MELDGQPPPLLFLGGEQALGQAAHLDGRRHAIGNEPEQP